MEKIDQPYAALLWWQRLTGNTQSGYQSGDNRASLAELRRSTVTAAALHHETIALFHALGYKNPAHLPRVAALATILANVKSDSPVMFGRAIGRTRSDDAASAPLKIGRFKAMLSAESAEDIATTTRRAVAIIDGAVNVKSVARFILYIENDAVRNRVALDYYHAGSGAPTAAAA